MDTLTAIKIVYSNRSAVLAYSCHEDFILTHGMAFSFSPNSERPGTRGQCFMNAATLAQRNPRKLFYAEGYATTSDPVFPVRHAWCVTKGGVVVDNSWDHLQEAGRAYFGVAFPLPVLMRILKRQKRYGLLFGSNFLFRKWRNTLSIHRAK